MARARSPNSIEAEKMYRSGMKLVKIAKKMGVPEGTVRRWKSTQKWDDKEKNKSERSEKNEGNKKANVRKLGPPKGNKNAEAKNGQYVAGVMSFEEKRKFKTPENHAHKCVCPVNSYILLSETTCRNLYICFNKP